MNPDNNVQARLNEFLASATAACNIAADPVASKEFRPESRGPILKPPKFRDVTLPELVKEQQDQIPIPPIGHEEPPKQSLEKAASTAAKDTTAIARIPHDWGTKPFFGAGELIQKTLQIHDRQWKMGIPDPTGAPSPAITMDHIEVLLAILSEMRGNYDSPEIRISYRKLRKITRCSNKSEYLQRLRKIVGDLRLYWCQVTSKDDPNFRRFALLKHMEETGPKDQENEISVHSLERIEFHPVFLEIVQASTMRIRVDVFCGLRGDLARALYLYLPSRAALNTAEAPFQITLTNLLLELRVPPPALKCHRKKVLAKSLARLNGIEIMQGRMHLELCETADGTDFKLLVWGDAIRCKQTSGIDAFVSREGSLVKAWRQSGRSDDLLADRLGKAVGLSEYDEENLAACNLDREKDHSFFTAAKAMMGEAQFNLVLRTFMAEMATNPTAKNAFAVVSCRILESISVSR